MSTIQSAESENFMDDIKDFLGGRFEIVGKLGEQTSVNVVGKGTKVRCVSDDECQSRWGGNDSAKEHLAIGAVYTLSQEPEVHSWHTKYYLEEVPGKIFNSVQFEVID